MWAEQVGRIVSMVLMVPSFNLSTGESENIVGARPSAVLSTEASWSELCDQP